MPPQSPRPPAIKQERVEFPFDHPQIVASHTWKAYKVPNTPGNRAFRLDGVEYINETGLAGAAGNGYVIAVDDGATVAATIANTNTSTGGAAIAANTFIDAALSATDANRIFQPGDVLSLVATLTGAATLPPGRIVLRGRLL
jgi:hypothetical protein